MCVICFDDEGIHDGLLMCSHSFHMKCIMRWWITQQSLYDTTSCPLCRHESDDDEIEFLRIRCATRMWLLNESKGLFKEWILKLKYTYIQRQQQNLPTMEDLLDAEEFVPSHLIPL